MLLALLLACGPTSGECDASADLDGDGLDDCSEQDLGTDPAVADSDGDGSSDLEEQECGTSPLDLSEFCYACGWEHDDPGTFSGSGAEVGDTVDNLEFFDQCGDPVELYDFSGRWNILFMTAAWCTSCVAEASELEERGASFSADNGVELQYLTVLFQDFTGDPAVPSTAEGYATNIGDPGSPVLSDVDGLVVDSTPYDGATLPGKCLLSPEMEIMTCWASEGDDSVAYDIILEGAR